MIWIMLATLAVVFVVGFRVLTSGARKAIRRLSDRLNIDVVPVESMVLSAYRPRLTCRVDKAFTPHPVLELTVGECIIYVLFTAAPPARVFAQC